MCPGRSPMSPDVYEALHRGDIRQNGEEPENDVRPAEEEKRTETDDSLRPGEDTDLVIEAERLRSRTGVRNEERARRAGIDEQGARRGVRRVMLDVPEQPEEEDNLGVAI